MIKFAIAAVAGLIAFQPAAAEAVNAETFIVTIPVYDLNLATADGAEALRNRSAMAARNACGREMRQLRDYRRTMKCREAFMSRVEKRIAMAALPARNVFAAR